MAKFHGRDILFSILALDPNAKVEVRGNDVNKITWDDGNPNNITNEQILAKQVELQAIYDAKQYQRDRATIAEKGGYPDVGDQLDMIYHDQVDGTTTFKDAIKAIKDNIPKP